MKLSDLNKSRVYFHLGMGSIAGIPAGDAARVEEACNDIKNDYMMKKVQAQLDRCDRAWELSELAGNDGTRFLVRELIGGDVNRTTLRESSKDFRIWKENYVQETRELAQLLWVPNYRDESSLRYRFERSGGEYINSLPGVADTTAISKVEAQAKFCGSFGF